MCAAKKRSVRAHAMSAFLVGGWVRARAFLTLMKFHGVCHVSNPVPLLRFSDEKIEFTQRKLSSNWHV